MHNGNYKGYMAKVIMFLVILGLVSSLGRSFMDDNLSNHFILQFFPEQTAMLEQKLDDNQVLQILNGELPYLNEAMDDINNTLTRDL